MRRRTAPLLSLLGCAILCAACQPSPSIPDGRPSLANDYFLPATPPSNEPGLGRSQQELTMGDGPQGQQVLFINFDGATLTRASNSGSSSSDNATTGATWVPNLFATGQSFAYPAFDTAPYAPTFDAATTKAKIAAQVTDWFKSYNVHVVTTRPPSGRYTMMMVGGTASSFISPAGSSVGVAPLDCGNSSQTNIGFAFAGNLTPNASASSRQRSITLVAGTIAHEAGHTFGLEHVEETQTKLDIMAPAVDPGVQGFLSGPQSLSDGAASCGSGSTQDTHQRLLSNIGPTPGGMVPPVGPTTGTPTVAFLSPKNGDSVPRAFVIAISASQAAGATGTITRVDIQQGTSVLTSLTTPPYQQPISIPAGIADGSMLQLTAVAYSSSGLSATTTTQFTVKSSATQGPIGCLVASDCESGKICQAGSCVEGTTPPPTGACEPGCTEGQVCQADGTCAAATSDGGTTPGATGIEVGKACVDATVCGEGGFCAATGSDRFCTRACTPSEPAACPLNYECATIDDAYYCRPSSSGCSAAGSRPSLPDAACLLFLGVLLVVRRVRPTTSAR